MINIKSKDEKVCISQTYSVTDEVCERINGNLDRFMACLKDMHINYEAMSLVLNKDLLLYKEMESVSEKDIRVFKTMCNTVMDFIEKLPVPQPLKKSVEPAINVPAQPIDAQVSENLKFCESVLKEYNETEDEFGIIGAIIYCGSDDKEIALPCGCINRELFRELLTLYVEKYGNGNYNQAKPAKSTAS